MRFSSLFDVTTMSHVFNRTLSIYIFKIGIIKMQLLIYLFDLCFACFVCESIHSLTNLLKCYNQRKCIMFVNTCICPVNSFLSSIMASLRARTFTNKHARTHAHTHAPINVHTHTFTSHIYYLNHVVCFTSCSCVMLCVFSFFAVLLSYMICTIMEEIKNIYILYGFRKKRMK